MMIKSRGETHTASCHVDLHLNTFKSKTQFSQTRFYEFCSGFFLFLKTFVILQFCFKTEEKLNKI